MSRRNTELFLLLVSTPLVFLFFATLAFRNSSELGLNVLLIPLGLFIAFLITHLVVRRFAPTADAALLPVIYAISGVGIGFVTRLAPNLVTMQIVWLFTGLACMILVLIFVKNIEHFMRYKYTLMIIGIALLALPMLPGIGREISGSRIWVYLGPLHFQPGEFAKVCLIIFLAGYLSAMRERLSVDTWKLGPFRLPDLSAFLPLLVMWGISMLIAVFEKDLGSALVFFIIFVVLFYIASGRKLYVVAALLLLIVGGIFLWMLFDHVQMRVDSWLKPFQDPQGAGYQICQSLYSLADGGLTGRGIGNGLAKLIPVVESDFIFVAIGEEMGLLGAAGVLLLFLCFAIRGFIVASQAKSDISSLIAAGLTGVIVVQAFIIVAGVTKLIPLTGITLPFISQGGSSMMASLIASGLILCCSDSGTGLDTEITNFNSSQDSVLGRYALGKRLVGVLIVFAFAFVILIANLTYIMVVKADEYQNMPHNSHTLINNQKNQRGSIITSDGVLLARSVQQEDGSYVREYPEGSFAAHVVGYASEKYGTSGIEAAKNDALTGKSHIGSFQDLIDNLAGKTKPGNDIKLTIDSKIQKAAEHALQGYKGAVVALNPKTGSVYAMASSPTYDLNNLEQIIKGSNTDDSAMYNRFSQALYSPGSSFKIVSLTTALEYNISDENRYYDAPGSMEFWGGNVSNFAKASYGNVTLRRGFELSSNTVFAQLGVEIGANRLVEGARNFGFEKDCGLELPVAKSLMPNPSEMTNWELGWSSAGEPVGVHSSPPGPQVTVMQMALVASAIANNGIINVPHLVESISSPNGVKSYESKTISFAQATSAAIAKRVKDCMVNVVKYGTGYSAQISGVSVAGKTGTAEKDNDKNNIWFVGFADAEDPTVAIAVLLEDSPENSAHIKAKEIMETILKKS